MADTRKVVVVGIVATFEGDYYDKDECPSVLEGWIDSAFCDRDNLIGWQVKALSVQETPLPDTDPSDN
ncbi:hypothetical protein [Streptomyces sp. NPDC017448]|uniref:hypothetical protein n=1 Tax=Streptomyces sp. NPDC017448 TaxID=3364996 RepID=UPI0037908505